MPSNLHLGVLPNTSKVAGILGTIWGFGGSAESIVFYQHRVDSIQIAKAVSPGFFNDRAIGKSASMLMAVGARVLIVVHVSCRREVKKSGDL